MIIWTDIAVTLISLNCIHIGNKDPSFKNIYSRHETTLFKKLNAYKILFIIKRIAKYMKLLNNVTP